MADPVSEGEMALMKRWVDQWKNIAGPELERLKKEELRAMTEAEALRRLKVVMNSRARHASAGAKAKPLSGLVEQQRIFSKARRLTRE